MLAFNGLAMSVIRSIEYFILIIAILILLNGCSMFKPLQENNQDIHAHEGSTVITNYLSGLSTSDWLKICIFFGVICAVIGVMLVACIKYCVRNYGWIRTGIYFGVGVVSLSSVASLIFWLL